MDEVRGNTKSVRDLLQSKKYHIDYYQREYSWGKRQISELFEDLAREFHKFYEEGQERQDVSGYGSYFLGPIIISEKGIQRFIVDGQQRLTALTLILIYLNHLRKGREEKGRKEKGPIAELIQSERFGKISFNLNIEEREACMEALFVEGEFDPIGHNQSIKKIMECYDNFDDMFDMSPINLREDALPFFIDWLIDNVKLVEITTSSDSDAYTIFETMNDRGLSLTPTDMLKSYLLSNITDESQRDEARKIWKDRIDELKSIEKEADADCIKAWLRSQYAKTFSVSSEKRGYEAGDFEKIGTGFNRWVRDNKCDLKLNSSPDFVRFIETDFVFFSQQYYENSWIH